MTILSYIIGINFLKKNLKPQILCWAFLTDFLSNIMEKCFFNDNFLFSLHPYIFFNEDRETFTFLGFIIDDSGRLKDHRTQRYYPNPIIDRNLKRILVAQNVNFDKSFEEMYNSR